MKKFSDEIKDFIRNTPWTFAKTYAETWPHEYLCVHYLKDTESFFTIVKHLRTYSTEGRFYKRSVWYFEEDGYTYWTMARKVNDDWDYPIEEEEIINRCRNEQTYESRLKNGTLPESNII